VNSGRSGSGHKSQDRSILETNLNAAREIARQIRLRDIGGLIVVDFIDMENQRDRKHVYYEMANHMKTDKAKHKILPINDLGLLCMSRQRVRESIAYAMSESCPLCEGLGRIVSQQTLAIKIEREIKKIMHEYKEIELKVHPSVSQFLDEERLQEWRKQYRMKVINVKVVPEFKYNQFEIEGKGLKVSRISMLFDDLFS
jgi:ribonuclease G